MTSACADMAPELEKLRAKSVQKIHDFLLQRVASLRKKMTNIQILQQSVLLKYKGLYGFLIEHAPEVARGERVVHARGRRQELCAQACQQPDRRLRERRDELEPSGRRSWGCWGRDCGGEGEYPGEACRVTVSLSNTRVLAFPACPRAH